MSIDVSILTKDDKTFTHVYSDGSKIVTFAVSLMLKSLSYKLIPVTRVKLSPKLAVRIMESGTIDRGVLERRMRVLDATPVTFLRGVEGFESVVLIDGVYRYCAAMAMNMGEIDARIVPMSVWQQFVVSGIPDTKAGMDELVKRKKGLLSNG